MAREREQKTNALNDEISKLDKEIDEVGQFFAEMLGLQV
jgi:hypothetical protein